MMSVAGISRSVAREWLADDRPLALATLVETIGSTPLEAGSMMLVDGDGRVEGSVTGGCVEGAVAERELERIAAPCGLDLGARTPEETAVSILAEIISARNRRSADPLKDTDDAIHA